MSRTSLERAIPDGDRVLLDTSTLAAYLDGGEQVSVLAAVIVDSFVRTGRNQAIVSMVTVMELLVRPLRIGARAPYRHVLDFLTHFPNLLLVEIDLAIAQEAASQRAANRFSAPDALIVATGLITQVGHLVTNDNQWGARLRPVSQRLKVCCLNDHLSLP